MSETTSGKILNFRLLPETVGPRDDGPRVTINTDDRNTTRDVRNANAGSSAARETSVAQIYPLARELNPQLYVAVEFIDEALELISEARKYLMENNRIAADDYALRVRALLPELFSCDKLGDGCRGVVLALLHSLINLEGALITQDQLVRMKEAFDNIRKQPFLDFEGALDVHELLESAGLHPDPKDVDAIVDVLDDVAEEGAEDSGLRAV